MTEEMTEARRRCMAEETLRKYYRELKPGDRVWIALHPCHGHAVPLSGTVVDLGQPGMRPQTLEYMRERGSVRVAYDNGPGPLPPDVSDPRHAPWGVYPTREMAAEALAAGDKEFSS